MVEKAKVIAIDTNEFQSLCDENTVMCYRVVQNVDRAVSPRLRFTKAREIDCNR